MRNLEREVYRAIGVIMAKGDWDEGVKLFEIGKVMSSYCGVLNAERRVYKTLSEME